jgi:menaquinol-cytochrome c reductase iron-sulfur subunit
MSTQHTWVNTKVYEPKIRDSGVLVDSAAGQAVRRRFFLTSIFGLWGMISAALSVLSLRYLFFPPRSRQDGHWVRAATLSDFTVDAPKKVVFQRNHVDGWKVSSEKASAWIVKQSDGRAVAFVPQCTHLGCAYHWDKPKNSFVCPCHASVFSIDGKVLSGPAPRPLDRYPIRVERGELMVGPLETSKKTGEKG